MEVRYCRLVTISTDGIAETNENQSGIGAHWPFLSDPRRIVQKDLDIAKYIDRNHNPVIPHVVGREPGFVIYKIYNDLRHDLRVVTMKCRPDWDITRRELKAAWQQGRKEQFHPYGKTYAETIAEQH